MSPYLQNPPPARPRLVAHLLTRLAPVAGEEDLAALIEPLPDSVLAGALQLDELATFQSLKAASRRARPVDEKKVVTHDGATWPVPRERMTDIHAIVARMGEDIASLARDAQDMEVRTSALVELGWSPAAIDAYGKRATRVAQTLLTLDEEGV